MDKHISNRNIDGLPPFPKMHIPWEKSKDEVWQNLAAKLEDRTVPVVRSLVPRRILYAVAASLLIILSLGSFMRFYTVNFSAQEEMAVSLPDKSTVKLSVGGDISWHPYWWKLNREVFFEGEGRFEVEKGKQFTVISEKGNTTVLGTVFTVNTTKKNYLVSCESGKVMVESNITASTVILTPGQKAEMKPTGELELKTIEPNHGPGTFSFTSAPLSFVLDEIGKAYGVKIELNCTEDLSYTGNFSKEISVESVLRLVCKPFGLKLNRQSENEYIIGK